MALSFLIETFTLIRRVDVWLGSNRSTRDLGYCLQEYSPSSPFNVWVFFRYTSVPSLTSLRRHSFPFDLLRSLLKTGSRRSPSCRDDCGVKDGSLDYILRAGGLDTVLCEDSKTGDWNTIKCRRNPLIIPIIGVKCLPFLLRIFPIRRTQICRTSTVSIHI